MCIRDRAPGAKSIFTGLGIGIVYNVLNRVGRLWKDTPEKVFGAPFNGASVSAEICLLYTSRCV